mmetsp:Transcript_36069/g.103780  ORF Transcript_36069/g.103780 Transcript_36069/m.103780 type:complete len:236 (+) Transcript_36069:62-769(+)
MMTATSPVVVPVDAAEEIRGAGHRRRRASEHAWKTRGGRTPSAAESAAAAVGKPWSRWHRRHLGQHDSQHAISVGGVDAAGVNILGYTENLGELPELALAELNICLRSDAADVLAQRGEVLRGLLGEGAQPCRDLLLHLKRLVARRHPETLHCERGIVAAQLEFQFLGVQPRDRRENNVVVLLFTRMETKRQPHLLPIRALGWRGLDRERIDGGSFFLPVRSVAAVDVGHRPRRR